MTSTELHVVVPAGGSGTRLWPLSRAANPKFLHQLTGTDRSLLQATFDRLAPLCGPDRLLVVTGAAHAASVARQLPELPERNVLVEPFARDSCAAIALAAAVIELRAPGGVMASFAADHLIAATDAFAATVWRAVEGARDGALMTIGITPTRLWLPALQRAAAAGRAAEGAGVQGEAVQRGGRGLPAVGQLSVEREHVPVAH